MPATALATTESNDSAAIMAARMGPLILPRTPYAVSSARNNFKIDRYLNFSTSQVSDRYSGVVCTRAPRRPRIDLYPDISRPGRMLATWFAHVLRTPRAMSMDSRVLWYKLGTDGHTLRHVRASERKIWLYSRSNIPID